MLTALTSDRTARVALPDFRSQAELESLRQRARRGELVCPGCSQRLILRAGEIRIPHFAHKSLSDCPHSSASESILAARTLIYRFFKDRIATGAIQAEVELEPAFESLPAKTHLDVLLKPAQRPPVAVSLLERNLGPDARTLLPRIIESNSLLFRPVFLDTRLKQQDTRRFLLDKTQRVFKQDCPYGITNDHSEFAPTLRFIDPTSEQWLSLRSIEIFEAPQSYSATSQFSPLAELQWDDAESEWIHPGEQEQLHEHRSRLALRLPRSPIIRRTPEPPPIWLQGLVCVGCNRRTTDWQNAVPMSDICVCSACFKNGVRLHS